MAVAAQMVGRPKNGFLGGKEIDGCEPLSSGCQTSIFSWNAMQRAIFAQNFSDAKRMEEAFFADFSEYFLPSLDVSFRCFRCVDRSEGEGEGG